MKWKDSDSNCEQHVKNKHGEQWDLVDADARNIFTSYAPNVIKCIAGTNQQGETIKCMWKSNKTSVCPSCSEIEDWNHVLLCENDTNKRIKKHWTTLFELTKFLLCQKVTVLRSKHIQTCFWVQNIITHEIERWCEQTDLLQHKNNDLDKTPERPTPS